MTHKEKGFPDMVEEVDLKVNVYFPKIEFVSWKPLNWKLEFDDVSKLGIPSADVSLPKAAWSIEVCKMEEYPSEGSFGWEGTNEIISPWRVCTGECWENLDHVVSWTNFDGKAVEESESLVAWVRLALKGCGVEEIKPRERSSGFGFKSKGPVEEKVLGYMGDNVANYIRYDNYCNNSYMNLAYWEADVMHKVKWLKDIVTVPDPVLPEWFITLSGDTNPPYMQAWDGLLSRSGWSDFIFVYPFEVVFYPFFWVGDSFWVLMMVGAVTFMGVLGGAWLENTGGGVLVGIFRGLFHKVLGFFYGRGMLVVGGLKKFWEVWAMAYFSLVVSEVLPFSTQVTFLGYPLVTLTVAGLFCLSFSSFLARPVGFIGGLIPSGVPSFGVPFVMVLLVMSSLLRPLVLAMRLTMGAVMMVTLEGIFHFWCVKAGDLHLSTQADRWYYFCPSWVGGPGLLGCCSGWFYSCWVSFMGIWSENVGLFGVIYLWVSGMLGLEKLFYMIFQVGLLCCLVMVYQQEHCL